MAELHPEREVKEFRFQQLCKFRVTCTTEELSKERVQLLTCSSKYSLTFVGVKAGLKVVDTQDLIKLDSTHSAERSKATVIDAPLKTVVPFSDPISHLALSCDDLTLIVVCNTNENVILYMYDVRAFSQKNAKPYPFKTIRLNASVGSTLSDVSWNPEVHNTVVTCTSDGCVELIVVNDHDSVSTLPSSANVNCFCWSPKGKQFVVGKKDGTLTQYDRTLSEKKSWDCPNILEGGPYQVVDIFWLSTYIFLVAYLPQSADPTDQPQIVFISSSKEGNTTYSNFEDICFGSGESRKAKYYMSLVPKWEMAVVCSANATETTIIGKNLTDKVTWEHWIMEDSGRAELPLTGTKCDSFPLGCCISYSSETQDPKSETASPLLILLSTDGLLVPFYMVYAHPEAVIVTKPPEQLQSTGERKGIESNAPVAQTTSLPSNSFNIGAKPFQSTVPASTGSSPFGILPNKQTTDTPVQPINIFSTPTKDVKVKPSFGGPTGFSFTSTAFPAASTIGTMSSAVSPAFNIGTSSELSEMTPGAFTFSGIKTSVKSASDTKTSAIVSTALSTFSLSSSAESTAKAAVFGNAGLTNSSSSSVLPRMTAASKPSVFTVGPTTKSSVTSGAGIVASTTTGQHTVNKTATSTSVDTLINETSEMTFTESVIEETDHFEKELIDLKLRTQVCKCEIGTKEELQKMKQNTDDFSKFCKDIQLVIKEQSIEVSDQKVKCLDAFALIEDYNQRKERDRDPKYHKLLRSRALDPASASTLRKIQQRYQAIEKGMTDVDVILDTQWDTYRNKQNTGAARILNPTSDTIYRAVRSNHTFISTMRNKVDEIQERLKHLQLYKMPLKQANLSDSLSRLEKSDAQNADGGLVSPKFSSCAHVISPEKQAKLQKMLMHRKVPKIKSTIPDSGKSRTVPDGRKNMRNTQVQSVPKFSDTLPTSSFDGQVFFKRPHPSSQPEQVQFSPDNGSSNLGLGNDNRVQIPVKTKLAGRFEGSVTSSNMKPVTLSPFSEISSVDLKLCVNNAREKGFIQSKYEDITPPSSSQTPNGNDDDYGEDDDEEDDDDEDYDEDDVGLGSEYDYISEPDLDLNSTPVIETDRNIIGNSAATSKNLFDANSTYSSTGIISGEKTSTSFDVQAAVFDSSSKQKGIFSFGQYSDAPCSFLPAGNGVQVSQPRSEFSLTTVDDKLSTFSFLSDTPQANLMSQAAVQGAAVSLSEFGTSKCKSPPRATVNVLHVKDHPNLLTLLSVESKKDDTDIDVPSSISSIFIQSAHEGKDVANNLSNFSPNRKPSPESADKTHKVTESKPPVGFFGSPTTSDILVPSFPAPEKNISKGVEPKVSVPVTTCEAKPKLFGISTTTSNSIFGQSSIAVTSALPSTVGIPSTTLTSSTGLFGKGTSPANSFNFATNGASSNVIGSPTTTTSDFDTTAHEASTASTLTNTSDLFGKGILPPNSVGLINTNTVFSSAIITSSTPSFGFGQTETTSSSTFEPLFGSTNFAFGNTAESSMSGFEISNPQLESGSTESSDQKTASPAAVYNQSTTQSDNSTNIQGGGLFSGLGGQPSAEKANTNVFGGNQAFETTSQQTGYLFGKNPNNSVFGSTSHSSGDFGSGGLFSIQSGGVSSTGFGANPPSQSVGGFGGAPTFGTSSAFGGSPTFGVKPSFGSGSTFFGSTSGSPNTALSFGSQSTFCTSPGVGAGTGNVGFSGFNSANSPTFGSIAQTDNSTFGQPGESNGGFNQTPGFGQTYEGNSQQPPTPSFGDGSKGIFGNTPSSSFSSYR